MIKSLNLPAITDTLPRVGLSAADLARELGVSREAVSKWLNGKSTPKPDKLLRLGMLLGLSFDELTIPEVKSAVPIVSFRRKGGRITRDRHLDKARDTGELLRRLVRHLPEQGLAAPPVLRDPRCDYDYVQKAAAETRHEMGIKDADMIEYAQLIQKFGRLHAIIVPVLWGERQYHGNALNIHLPDCGITWIYLNLDSNAIDFKFWMAHELGHALAPKLSGEEGEDFADMFAQALLYPEAVAAELRTQLARRTNVGQRINAVKSTARERRISPVTIRYAIKAYEAARGLAPLELGAEASFMGAARNVSKEYETVTETLFTENPPSPADYAAIGRRTFDSQFFESLAAYCRNEDGAEHFIHSVLDLPLADAKALAAELAR